jgi:hypothetical protein
MLHRICPFPGSTRTCPRWRPFCVKSVTACRLIWVSWQSESTCPNRNPA